MKKITLDALMFSMDEYSSIEKWSKNSDGMIQVKMPSGVASGELTRVIYLPDIQNTNTSGVLIADHRKFRKEQIRTVIRQLRLRDKWLYSATNGIEPLRIETERSNELQMSFIDSPILKILNACRPALRWLDEKGPTPDVPKKYADSIKMLEKLGFVFRRNNKTFSLRRHRLRKVLAHESQKSTKACKLEDLLSA